MPLPLFLVITVLMIKPPTINILTQLSPELASDLSRPPMPFALSFTAGFFLCATTHHHVQKSRTPVMPAVAPRTNEATAESSPSDVGSVLCSEMPVSPETP